MKKTKQVVVTIEAKQVDLIAGTADVDRRSVMRLVAGLPMRPRIAARIRAAAKSLGIPVD